MWKTLRTSMPVAAMVIAGVTTAQARHEIISPAAGVEASGHEQAGIESLSDVQARAAGNYIFVLRDDVPASAVEGLARSLVARAGGKLGHVYENSVYGFSARMSGLDAERMSASPMVAYYEPDAVATTQMQMTDWGVQRVNGPLDGTGLGLYAFVIDTGVDMDHPDLTVDAGLSTSCVNSEPTPDDFNGHGTHVAGIMAARNNSIGTVGVAAGATIVAAKALTGSGGGTFADIIECVDYVAQVGLPNEVANMSLGGPRNTSLNNAVESAASRGIFFSIAAGNEGQFAGNVSPASASGANVYTISAIDINDNFASFSNWGNPPVDCAAPGVNIKSLWNNGGTNTISGTSMAAPHAGAIFLLSGGVAYNGGPAGNDPDGNPDPICVHSGQQ